MLKLVLPKGSLEEQTLRLMEAADLHVRRGSSRDYHGNIDDDRVERVSLLRPQEIPQYVAEGFFDLGITGRDWVEETGADVEELASLEYAKSGTGHGVKVVLEKHVLKVMDSATVGIPKGDPDYYHLDVPYALRVTWSGEFDVAARFDTDRLPAEQRIADATARPIRNTAWGRG
jgi:hypothetical protein